MVKQVWVVDDGKKLYEKVAGALPDGASDWHLSKVPCDNLLPNLRQAGAQITLLVLPRFVRDYDLDYIDNLLGDIRQIRPELKVAVVYWDEWERQTAKAYGAHFTCFIGNLQIELVRTLEKLLPTEQATH